MKSSVADILPPRVRRGLAKLGQDIRDARRTRNLTVEMMVERVGVSKATYLKVEKGNPSVAMRAYAMTLFALGFSNAFADLANPASDSTGMLIDRNRLPQRVRPKRAKPL